jgi:hypothetical protein
MELIGNAHIHENSFKLAGNSLQYLKPADRLKSWPGFSILTLNAPD